MNELYMTIMSSRHIESMISNGQIKYNEQESIAALKELIHGYNTYVDFTLDKFFEMIHECKDKLRLSDDSLAICDKWKDRYKSFMRSFVMDDPDSIFVVTDDYETYVFSSYKQTDQYIHQNYDDVQEYSISKTILNNDKHTTLMVKYNGINNPHSVYVNGCQELFIPEEFADINEDTIDTMKCPYKYGDILTDYSLNVYVVDSYGLENYEIWLRKLYCYGVWSDPFLDDFRHFDPFPDDMIMRIEDMYGEGFFNLIKEVSNKMKDGTIESLASGTLNVMMPYLEEKFYETFGGE